MSIDILNTNQWRIVTDQTERNGTSSFSISNNKPSLNISAQLIPISGERNSLVGFAGAELNLPDHIPYDECMVFSLELESSKEFTLTLTLINDKGLRFQHDLKIHPDTNNYKVQVSQFKRTSRGRVLSGHIKKGDDLITIGLSVLYSRQVTNGESFEAHFKVKNLNL